MQTEKKEMCRTVTETVDTKEKQETIGFSIEKFVKNEGLERQSKLEDQMEGKGVVTSKSYCPIVQQKETERVVEFLDNMASQSDVVVQVNQQRINAKSKYHLPEGLIQRGGGIIHIIPKCGERYDFVPVADFCFLKVQKVKFILPRDGIVQSRMLKVTVLKSNQEMVEFYLSEEEVESDKLFTIIQKRVKDWIHLNDTHTKNSILIRNLLYAESKHQEEMVDAYYPGFFIAEDFVWRYAYGNDERDKVGVPNSGFRANSHIVPSNVFDCFESNLEKIRSVKTRQLLFVMLLQGIWGIFLQNKFTCPAPAIVVNCKTTEDVNGVNAYMGAFFHYIDGTVKKLDDVLGVRKSGVSTICFSSSCSNYKNQKLLNQVNGIIKHDCQKESLDANFVVTNVRNTVLLEEESCVFCDYVLEDKLDLQAIYTTTRDYLCLIIEWTLNNAYWIKEHITSRISDDYLKKWNCLLEIAEKFASSYHRKLPAFVDTIQETFEECADINPLDNFEFHLEWVKSELLQDLMLGNAKFVNKRLRNVFIVENETNYDNNFYFTGGHMFINVHYFNQLVRRTIGKKGVEQFLREMEKKELLENLDSLRGSKISVSLSTGEPLARLNVWKISRAIFGEDVQMLGGVL